MKKYLNYKILGIGIIIFIFISCFLVYVIKNNIGSTEEINNSLEKDNLIVKEDIKVENRDNYFFVDIKGEVNKPGVYKVKSSMIIQDLINLSGGLTKTANTKAINLSKKLKEEMVVVIYSNDEVDNFIRVKEETSVISDNCNTSAYDIKNDGCIFNDSISVTNEQKVVNINIATKEELMGLTGIGEAKALDIIKYREEEGNFKTIEDIKNISGIGESIFAKIKENITV